ncbi:pyrroline-5-carboxylate reductase [Orrella dioscoreae]|uniref:Pyrroline-5-carboxylate reductase n=2 Tax=root TaxID=1 RepID=A0A1C3JYA8_9BURK|nr:pyrroline-5-carboxylate reductase [Orrella dioscoreae]SBT24251.1 Pyrroline-5-carboxylate reductase [Orrella dioscoreae]SOE49909.1 Pyrroline-5-carboxylate reductase [Orrella dioscoreae]
MATTQHTLSIAFIGGGNMAAALAAGLAGRLCPASAIHVLEINESAHDPWLAKGMTVSARPDDALAGRKVWVYAVKPQQLQEAVAATRAWLDDDTLVLSVAAGIRSDTLAAWLGTPDAPWQRLVRCMPNTPALVGAGATGLAALPGATAQDRDLAQSILGSVGLTVWVADDAALDAVTALSGSGPAYVFLFLESLIQGAQALGLDARQARQLALATLDGATQLAAESTESPAVLRERVTSKGGTTAAALAVFAQAQLPQTVAHAMAAAAQRGRELGDEFGGAAGSAAKEGSQAGRK